MARPKARPHVLEAPWPAAMGVSKGGRWCRSWRLEEESWRGGPDPTPPRLVTPSGVPLVKIYVLPARGPVGGPIGSYCVVLQTLLSGQTITDKCH